MAENAEGNIIELKPFTVFVSTFTPNQGTPVFEDMRYFPEKIQIVETQSSAQFSNHTAIFSAPSKGEYTLEVTYRSEIFDGEKWAAHTESVTNQKEKIQEMNHQMETLLIRIGQQKKVKKMALKDSQKRENLIIRC